MTTGQEFDAPVDVVELLDLAYGPKPYLDRFVESASTAMAEKLDRKITSGAQKRETVCANP